MDDVERSRSREFVNWTILACLAYVMLRPVGANLILVPTLALLVGLSMYLLVLRGRISNSLLVSISLVVVMGIFGVVVGANNPGVLDGFLVWIVAPVGLGAFAAAGDRRMVRRILSVSAWTTVISASLALLYAAGESGAVPFVFPDALAHQLGAIYDASNSRATAMTMYSLSTLVAAVPMWLSASVLPRHPLLPPKWLAALAGGLGLAATLLTGRAALIAVTGVVPVVVWVAWRIVTRRVARPRWMVVAPFAVGAIGAVSLAILMTVSDVVTLTWNRVVGSLNGEYATHDDEIRGHEAAQLIAAWRKSPVIGHGWGATIDGYVRSEARPWNFELQYHLLLFQVGIVGVTILLAATLVAAFGLLVATRRNMEMLPAVLVVSAGALSMIAANASNPYLRAPGNMWPVYLLLMLSNTLLLENRSLSPRWMGGSKCDRFARALQSSTEWNFRKRG